MNKIFSTFLFLLLTFWSYGQKVLTEGLVKMEITTVNADDPQMAMQMEMMKGSKLDIFFKGEDYITDMNMMGGLMLMKNKINHKANKMDLFMDMMGQKIWIESNLDEVSTPEQKEMAEKSQIDYDKNDKKVILGYNCYKMTIQNLAMEGMKVTAYVTDEIKTKAKVIRGFESVEYQGFPLEFEVDNSMFTMKMETKSIEEKVKDSDLTVDTAGYKKMTMKEFQESFGGMGF